MGLEDAIKVFIEKVFKYYRWKIDRKFIFEVHLADHCNLNCSCCSHFSPIAEECFLNVDDYKKDCEQIARITKKYVYRIHLMGGEPLLHKNIVEIIEITRSNFEKSTIAIVTNGILLDKMDAKFWNACKQYNAMIFLTLYPVNLNMKKIYEQALQYGVAIGNFGTGYKMKFRKDTLDEKGIQNKKHSYRKCKALCPQLYKGKFYMCQKPAYVKYINKYFSSEFVVSPEDYIDIYQTNTIKTLWKYLRKPIPFCRYCNKDATDRNITWCKSKKEISEWI
jgi:MoaA/NifB/PqqE/SkfB family radical SAM enzyme